MNLDLLKKILKKDNSKIIIIEEGKPLMVILSFEDYLKDLEIEKGETSSQRLVQSSNQSFGFLKEESRSEEKVQVLPHKPSDLQKEKLTIEDLPL